MTLHRSAGFIMVHGLSLVLLFPSASAQAQAAVTANSSSPALVQVPAGTFQMGQPREGCDRDLCFAELPAHQVRISQPFRMSVTEVTAEQFRQFKPEFRATRECLPYATGVSWHDAVAFCEWLGQREGKPYRLPTEAEWEYAARQTGKLGLSNIFSAPLEWCLNWFGDYSDQEQTDPVGPDHGLARVVRGGCLDQTKDVKDYAHASHRGGMAPGWRRMQGQAQVDILGSRKGYNIFVRTVPKGPLMLGGNDRTQTGAVSMYFAIIK